MAPRNSTQATETVWCLLLDNLVFGCHACSIISRCPKPTTAHECLYQRMSLHRDVMDHYGLRTLRRVEK